MATGTVAALYRWPVKSFAGERMRSLSLEEHGVDGDRAYAVWHPERGTALSARQEPRLLEWSATYEGRDPATNPPFVTAPEGSRHEWGDEAVGRMLRDALGRGVALSDTPGRNHDRAGTLLVTTEATRRAVEATLDLPLDVRRFRPNVHLELDAPAYAEEAWKGIEIRFEGGAVLELLEPCDRCVVTTHEPARPSDRRPEVLRTLQLQREALFGIRAAVRRTGTVWDGEPAEVGLP